MKILSNVKSTDVRLVLRMHVVQRQFYDDNDSLPSFPILTPASQINGRQSNR